MKILILNGSPRCQGLISRMLDIMAEEARIRGAEVEAISIHKLQVRPCTGCMACRSRQACVLPEDDAERESPGAPPSEASLWLITKRRDAEGQNARPYRAA